MTAETLVSQFKDLKWEDRYQLIIKIGKELDPLPENEKSEDLKVKGCQSQVWLKANLSPNGNLQFRADSDALIVRGLIALVLQVYSDRTPAEIIALAPDFVKDIGLDTHLSPSRANGLFAMIKQIKYYAVAFQALSKK
jgi:cysteine desulfuration protein SufE